MERIIVVEIYGHIKAVGPDLKRIFHEHPNELVSAVCASWLPSGFVSYSAGKLFVASDLFDWLDREHGHKAFKPWELN